MDMRVLGILIMNIDFPKMQRYIHVNVFSFQPIWANLIPSYHVNFIFSLLTFPNNFVIFFSLSYSLINFSLDFEDFSMTVQLPSFSIFDRIN